MIKNFDFFYDSENDVYQVRTKSEAFVFEFQDSVEKDVFLSVVKLYSQYNFFSFSQLTSKLDHYPHDKVLDVVQQLQDCGLLNPTNFQGSKDEDNLYNTFSLWHGLTSSPSSFKIGLIAHNPLGQLLKDKLNMIGYSSVVIYDVLNDYLPDEALQEIVFGNDFLVVDATFWNPRLMKTINEYMLRENKPWLYVSGMIDTINYSIGPLFHGQETGCYECLQKRIDSNDNNYNYSIAYWKYLEKNDKFSKNLAVNECVEDVVADIISLDINKYILGIDVPETWKNTLYFNTSSYSVSKQ